MKHSVKVVPHPSIPKGYIANFTLSGSPPEWIIDFKGSRRVFLDPSQAELAAYRELIGRINGSEASSKPRPWRGIKQNTPVPKGEAEKVFSRFTGKDKKALPDT